MAETPKDPQARLRELANKWALRARDYARDSKAADAPADKAAYARGLAEGFYKAATELADVLKTIPADGLAGNSTAAPSAPAASAAPSAPAVTYLKIDLGEALRILDYAGVNPRDVQPRPDNSFLATFSSWENIQPHDRITRMKQVDLRLIVLESGKVKDTHDPFVVFAFKE